MTGFEALPLILTGLGTAVSAVGAIKQGSAANRAAKFNAQVASNNAIAARRAAAEDARRFNRQTMKRMGTMRAGGASLDLLEDSAMEEELERLSILHGGEIQAAGFTQTATLERARGKAAVRKGRFGAAATLLTGGAKIASKLDLGAANA